jgi:predicted DNA-binding transcriptional regulator YafY
MVVLLLLVGSSGAKPIMRDESSLRRQWLLLKALSSRRLGLTVREMAADLGVTDKTVRRDLALFRRVGFPLGETVGEFGRKTWRIAPAGNQPPLSFSFDEAVALYLGRRLLDPLAGTAFGDAARRAAEKIRATLGRSALEYLDRFAGFFHSTAFGAHDYARRAEVIDALLFAIEEGRVARLLYRAEREAVPSGREVHPYGLIYHLGALYLAALDPGEARVKISNRSLNGLAGLYDQGIASRNPSSCSGRLSPSRRE